MPAANDVGAVFDLEAFLGRRVDTGQAEAVIGIVTAMASAYTRGNGFTAGETIEPDLRAVILSASARLLRDPTGTVAAETMGPFSMSYRNGFDGWTTAELFVLNRYRDRAR